MQQISFNDNWILDGRKVRLPHDAMITEKRSADASDGGHGYFPGGIYTYTKTFVAPMDWAGKNVSIEFEGVYKNARIFLNDVQIGSHAYGYTGFTLSLENLEYGGENALKVIADNSKLPNSRWYTGSGIYRPVWLYIEEKDGLKHDAVKISTVALNPATIHVSANQTEAAVEIYDGDSLVANGKPGYLAIENAKLWSAETPHLYTCIFRPNGMPFSLRPE